MLIDKLRQIAAMALRRLRRVLDIPSPSRVFSRPMAELTPTERKISAAIMRKGPDDADF